MNFTWEALEQARKNKEKLFGVYARLLAQAKEVSRPMASDRLSELLEALHDDLNTPLALAKALELASEHNALLDDTKDFGVEGALQDWQVIFHLFGLLYTPQVVEVPEEVQKLAELREEARKDKDFAKADEYRAQIEALGYTVKDTPEGFEILP